MNGNKINGICVGFVLLTVGIINLLISIDVLPEIVGDYVCRWEILIIILGVLILSRGLNIIGGFIMLFLGVFLYLEVFFSTQDILNWMWPVSLILIGVYLIFIRKIISEKEYNSFKIK